MNYDLYIIPDGVRQKQVRKNAEHKPFDQRRRFIKGRVLPADEHLLKMLRFVHELRLYRKRFAGCKVFCQACRYAPSHIETENFKEPVDQVSDTDPKKQQTDDQAHPSGSRTAVQIRLRSISTDTAKHGPYKVRWPGIAVPPLNGFGISIESEPY